MSFIIEFDFLATVLGYYRFEDASPVFWHSLFHSVSIDENEIVLTYDLV